MIGVLCWSRLRLVATQTQDDELSPEEIWRQADDFHSMMLSAMFVRSGVNRQLDPEQFPATAAALRQVVGMMTGLALDAERLERESRLPEHEPATDEGEAIDADAVDVPEPDDEALPPPKPVKELPPGIDLNAGWPHPAGPGFARR
jgi:hypothetical protein